MSISLPTTLDSPTELSSVEDTEITIQLRNVFDRLEKLPPELIGMIMPSVMKRNGGFGLVPSDVATVTLIDTHPRIQTAYPKMGKAAADALSKLTVKQPMVFELNKSTASELGRSAITAHLRPIQGIIVTEIPTSAQSEDIYRTNPYYVHGSPFCQVKTMSFSIRDIYFWDQDSGLSDSDSEISTESGKEDDFQLKQWYVCSGALTPIQTRSSEGMMRVCVTEQHTNGQNPFSEKPQSWDCIIRGWDHIQLTIHGCRALDNVPRADEVHMILPKGFPKWTETGGTAEEDAQEDFYTTLANSLRGSPEEWVPPTTLTMTDPSHLEVEDKRSIYQHVLKLSRRLRDLPELTTEDIEKRMSEGIKEAGSSAIMIDREGDVHPTEVKVCGCCLSMEGIRSVEERCHIEPEGEVASEAATVAQQRLEDLVVP